MSRYNGRVKANNSNEMYENILQDRGVKKIYQYTTGILSYPDDDTKRTIRTVDYEWKQGDKFWRLSSQYYGDPRNWWIIAQFNQKPTEGHLSPGDVIQIPLDLGVALGALK